MAKPPKKIVNPNKITQNSYSDQAYTMRHSESGHVWTPVGAINTAKQVLPQTSVLLYNSDTAVHFVKFGGASVSAPTNASNGIPILASSTLVVSPGMNTYMISDSATVFAYTEPADPITYDTKV